MEFLPSGLCPLRGPCASERQAKYIAVSSTTQEVRIISVMGRQQAAITYLNNKPLSRNRASLASRLKDTECPLCAKSSHSSATSSKPRHERKRRHDVRLYQAQ